MDGTVFFWQWEESFIVWLQQIGANGALNAFLIALNNFFSFLGEEYVAIGVLGVLYWGIDKKRAERVGFAVLSSLVCNVLVKNRFRRLRPWLSSDRIGLLREVDGYSFPSAHSSSATALYPTLASEYRKAKWLRIPAVIVPFLIAVSRCYLGAHWPTDVLTGLAFGLIFCVIAETVLPRVKNKYIVYLITLGIGALGLFYCTTEDYFTNLGLFAGFTLSMFFEEKVVNFQNTKCVPAIICRTLGGGLVFFAGNLLFKAILGNIFAEGTFAALLMRTVRYTLVVFVSLGVYPLAFGPVERLVAKFGTKKREG